MVDETFLSLSSQLSLEGARLVSNTVIRAENLCKKYTLSYQQRGQHYLLFQRTQNTWLEHFEALDSCDYRTFVWFDKFGEFSHFMYGFDRDSVNNLSELCLRNEFEYDLHYDVIALHRNSLINPVGLAELSFAKVRKSKCQVLV